MSGHKCIAYLLGLFAIWSAMPAQANVIYDAAADFSVSSNPNGVWSYGYSSTLGAAFVLDDINGTTLAGNPNFSFWGTNIGLNHTPVVFSNTSATDQQAVDVILTPGEMALHPGPSGEVSIVRWVSPGAANITLNAAFTGRDTGGTTTDVHILLDGVSLFDGLVNGFGPGSGPSFSTSIGVLPGDIIDFAVGFGPDGSYDRDTTGLDATVTVSTGVPEPGSLVLLGSSLLSLGLIRRRRASGHHRRQTSS